MARSFDLVDFKVAEAHFFLSKMSLVDYDLLEMRFLFSAFVSACRTITLSLQATLHDSKRFTDWYAVQQEQIRNDPLARFFHAVRNDVAHVGVNPIRGGAICTPGSSAKWHFRFDDCPNLAKCAPDTDVVESCRRHFVTLLGIIFECYVDFGPDIDPHQRYTEEYFQSIGKTIEDAEDELFGHRGWTSAEGIPPEYRWQMLRGSVPGCRIEWLFQEYLGKTLPHPAHIPMSEAEGGGWVYIPESWHRTGAPEKDIKGYLADLRDDKGD